MLRKNQIFAVVSRTRTILLLGVALSSFTSAFNSSAVNIIIKSITQDVKLNVIQQNMFVTLFILAAAMFLVPSGKLSDIKGRKKFFEIGLLLYILFSVIIGFISKPSILLLCRFFQGVGVSLFFATSLALLGSAFPPRNRGLVFGINVTSVYLGLSLGPFLGAIIAKHFGWRTIFFLNAPLGLIALCLIYFFVKDEWKNESKAKTDYLGIVLYSTILFAVIYGFRQISTWWGGLLIGSSVFLGAIFVWWERKKNNPILDLRIFEKNRYFSFSFLTALLFYTATYAISFSLSLYLQYYMHYDPVVAGLIILPQPLLQAIFSPVAGRFSDIKEKRIIVSIGILLVISGIGILLFVFSVRNISLVVFSLCTIGIGYAFFSSPNSNAIMSSISKKFFGVASSLIATARTIGKTLSFGLSTLISVVVIGNINVDNQSYPSLLLKSLKILLPILFIISIASLVASVSRGKEKQYWGNN